MEALGANMKEVQSLYLTRPSQVFKMCLQLVERIKVLHTLKVVHGDLKLQNIVMQGL